MSKVPLTKEGAEKLRQELRRLKTADRPNVVAAIAEARAPVSYTHLRAHETVLDLVCRLLLEKKKNISTHPPSRT